MVSRIHPYVKEKEYTFRIPNNNLTNYTHQQNTSQYGTFNRTLQWRSLHPTLHGNRHLD